MSYLTNAGYDATYPPDEEYVDEDIARDEDNYGRARRCTCGRLAALEDYDRSPFGENFPHEAFAGCRGCDPVDHECKPYGFGVELSEDESRNFAGRIFHPGYASAMICAGWLTRPLQEEMRRQATTVNLLRLEASWLVWDRSCDESESHRQAVERYKAWAKRALAFRFRDDLFPE